MAKAKQEDIPGVEGVGVSIVKDKKLEALADAYVEDRDEKAEIAERMTGTETKIVGRMVELGITTFKYADKVVTIKKGAVHVKVKTVKNEGAEDTESGD